MCTIRVSVTLTVAVTRNQAIGRIHHDHADRLVDGFPFAYGSLEGSRSTVIVASREPPPLFFFGVNNAVEDLTLDILHRHGSPTPLIERVELHDNFERLLPQGLRKRSSHDAPSVEHKSASLDLCPADHLAVEIADEISGILVEVPVADGAKISWQRDVARHNATVNLRPKLGTHRINKLIPLFLKPIQRAVEPVALGDQLLEVAITDLRLEVRLTSS